MDKCLLPYCSEHSLHTYFCLKHNQDWLNSEQRKLVIWTSDESYDAQAQAFVQHMLQTSVEDIVVAPREEKENHQNP